MKRKLTLKEIQQRIDRLKKNKAEYFEIIKGHYCKSYITAQMSNYDKQIIKLKTLANEIISNDDNKG